MLKRLEKNDFKRHVNGRVEYVEEEAKALIANTESLVGVHPQDCTCQS